MHPVVRRLALACLVGCSAIIVALSLGFFLLDPFLGFIWLYVWAPYVAAACLAGGVTLACCSRSARLRVGLRPLVALLGAWVLAWPLGAGLAAGGTYLGEFLNVRFGTATYEPTLSLSGYYWWTSIPLVAVYVLVTLAFLFLPRFLAQGDSAAMEAGTPTPPEG